MGIEREQVEKIAQEAETYFQSVKAARLSPEDCAVLAQEIMNAKVELDNPDITDLQTRLIMLRIKNLTSLYSQNACGYSQTPDS